MKALVALPLLALTAVVAALGVGLIVTASRSPALSADVVPARVEGDRMILDTTSRQLAALVAAPVAPAEPPALHLNGRVVWNENVTVRVFSPFAGRVVDVGVDLGHRVGAGEVLATIAAPDYGQAQADARRAATDLAWTERSLARLRDLLAHGVVAQKEVDAAEADAARARAEAERATARVALYGSDSAGVTALFQLRTPIAGTIVGRAINPGQEVRPDQMLANAPQLFAPLFVVTDPTHLWVQLDVPERDVRALVVGAPLEIRTAAWPDRVFRGRLTLVGSDVDPTTRTVKARGVIENAAALLKAEMLVSVNAPAAGPRVLGVPASAVVLEGDTHVVFVEEQRGHYRRCHIQVGEADGDLVRVLAGLEPGDRVVIANALLLEQLFNDVTHS
ncbi:MAG TPA: efflux RND transporter periplasmic adaptor subunit [Gemmatimonadales bacterium]|nr:efflux RND transporter periplasmic adaptor subunit [Gemmatimonadales bacterium]